MKKLWLMLLALMIATMPVGALAEAAAGDVETAVQEAVDMPLMAPDESDYDDHWGTYLLDQKKESFAPFIGMNFDIILGGATGAGWKSSKPSVASVSASGRVECLAEGKAKITVKATAGGKTETRTLTLTVNDPAKPQEVWLVDYFDEESEENVYYDHGATVTCIPGELLAIEPRVFPDTAEYALTWSLSNKKVASFTDILEVYCYKPGKTKLTVSTDNGKKAELNLLIKKNKWVHNYVDPDNTLSYAIDDKEVDVELKAVEILAADKAVATIYVYNGTDRKIDRLDSLKVGIYAGYHDIDPITGEVDWAEPDWKDFLEGTFTNVKVGLKPHKYKKLNFTFTGDMVVDPVWRLDHDLIELSMGYTVHPNN